MNSVEGLPPVARVKGYLNPGTCRGKLTAGHADETVKATPLMNYANHAPRKATENSGLYSPFRLINEI